MIPLCSKVLLPSFFFIGIFIIGLAPAHAQLLDNLLDLESSSSIDSKDDDQKTPDQLIREATILLADKRLLDGRTKLLKVLEKDPKFYKAHAMLSEYYMVHIGHYRLALRYVKRALELFREQRGPPPYDDMKLKSDHAYLLYLLSQVRLNLDEYQAALQVLDEYTEDGYFGGWYPGSRAWILMKLGRVKEAIQVARIGLLTGAEEGRTLNMLGILLSMDNEPQQALEVFRRAISLELSFGSEGQPATPLNNSGEVYREQFDDERAESSWRKAIRLPDGCDHVLPSLNLSLLLMDQLRHHEVTQTMNDFESCVAQFPLRNGEEHKALVHLARGRVSLHDGHAEDAIRHFEDALQGVQWFGKIGTTENDLLSATFISLAQALEARNHQLGFTRYLTLTDWGLSLKERAYNTARIWWTKRRARQLLAEDLNDLEDLRIRNTDSLIDYASFGDLLEDFPSSILSKRISKELSTDSRPQALLYYDTYRAQALLREGDRNQANTLLNEVQEKVRDRYDLALTLQIFLLKLRLLPKESPQYQALAEKIFRISKSALRDHGFSLPVRYRLSDPNLIRELGRSGFILHNTSDAAYEISGGKDDKEYALKLEPLRSDARDANFGKVTVKGEDLFSVVNKFSEAIFTEESQDRSEKK